jgi:hypothetical protein
MRARFEVASRLAAACLTLIIAGCGGGGGGGSQSGSAIAFTQGAMRAVPLVRPAAPGAALRAAQELSLAANIEDSFFAKQLFQMQCRRSASEGVDYCPPGTPSRDAYAGAPFGDPYQLNMQTLIGFIYHAQMYTELVTDCSGQGLTPETVTSASYAAASSDAAADPTRFVFDQYGTYTCRSTQISDTAHETRMVSAVSDGSYQTTLHSRYKYDSGDHRAQTDFFQVDISMNAGAPEFLAFNFASAEPLSSRLVLLVNLINHRFAMKYYTPEQPSTGGPTGAAPHRYAVSVGAAGYDFTTGNPNAGHYYLRFLDDPGVEEVCVDNVGGVFEPDFTACDAEGIPASWGVSAIQEYLGVPAATAARIGDYLAVFADTGDLAAATADNWSVTTSQSTDADLYWPASLN